MITIKIREIFESGTEDVTIESYLLKCGVENPQLYLTHNTVEDSSNYENIKQAKELILKYVGGDVIVE